MLEMKISKLEDMISKARVIDQSRIDTSKVQILNRVKIKNLSNNQEMEYLLVSETEADLKAGKIAVNSPIAHGLLGKKVGDIVEIKVPSGRIKFEIINISI
jgi:transcription elongation factor GreA